jgi:hypothetical protein
MVSNVTAQHLLDKLNHENLDATYYNGLHHITGENYWSHMHLIKMPLDKMNLK